MINYIVLECLDNVTFKSRNDLTKGNARITNTAAETETEALSHYQDT